MLFCLLLVGSFFGIAEAMLPWKKSPLLDLVCAQTKLTQSFVDLRLHQLSDMHAIYPKAAKVLFEVCHTAKEDNVIIPDEETRKILSMQVYCLATRKGEIPSDVWSIVNALNVTEQGLAMREAAAAQEQKTEQV